MGNKKIPATIFEQCYKDYYESLMNFARARLGEYSGFSEDCVHEAYVVFYKRLQTGEEFENPRAFLYRVLDNIVKKQKSKKYLPILAFIFDTFIYTTKIHIYKTLHIIPLIFYLYYTYISIYHATKCNKFAIISYFGYKPKMIIFRR